MTPLPPPSILFLGKRDDEPCASALQFLQSNFSDVSSHLGEWGDALPDGVRSWSGDYLISYLSRWVVPDAVLGKAKIAAINFHPASPEYPGIGCTNFALYEEAEEFGVTCHHMARKVDTGRIIAVRRFPVYPTDDVASLLSRTYAVQIDLFYEITDVILRGDDLPSAEERWSREPFSRKQFNELTIIKPDMDEEEVRKRVRATTFGKWRPTREAGETKFE